ncbi:DNA-binding protein [Brevibacillus sp. AG]|uniref:helix-turn-helix domain-containing protein n=1 Tax=Brevibacillus sp. AG TaxID=3020891 RepID=UPI002331409F|nr:DNA-binding protein [Brevibacillus sp. AG]MDC0764928.1 DNA-binding protein [Brevibacillus sp. AG]
MREGKTVQRSIRSEIVHHLKDRGYTLSKLGDLAGIRPGHMSEILNGNPSRALTVGQLDAIGEVFGHEAGWLYELYAEEECFSEGKVSKWRVVPFLVRCAAIGRHDCIEMTVSRLLDNPKNVSILFSIAEQLFQSGRRKESVVFYQYVIDTEKNSYEERFLLSQYRLFQALQGTNTEEHWAAVIRFEPYRKRLSENYQLDALLKLANVCFLVQKWKEVEKYADELRILATAVYEDKRKSSKDHEPLQTERHLVVYYGQGFLAKGVALQMQGLYEEAKECVNGYADLGWFEFLDEIGKEEVEKFRYWATANMYTYDILLGNIDILPTYLDFLVKHPNEIHAGLLTIMEAACKYNISVDHILEKYSEEINRFNIYHDPVNIGRHYHFRYCKALYEYKRGSISVGLEETLRCLDLSDKMNHHGNFKRSTELFWENRQYASEQQNIAYHNILKGGSHHENKGVFAVTSGNI